MNNKKRYHAHKAEVERIIKIPEGKRTAEEIKFLTDDADAKNDKSVNYKKRRQAHEAEHTKRAEASMISAGFADSSLGLGLERYHGRIVVRAVDRTVCKRPVRVGDVLMAILDMKG